MTLEIESRMTELQQDVNGVRALIPGGPKDALDDASSATWQIMALLNHLFHGADSGDGHSREETLERLHKLTHIYYEAIE